MGWIYVREAFGREYGDSQTGQSAKRVFDCLSDTDIIDIDEVLAANDGATAIPGYGDSYPGNTSLRVTKRDVNEDGHEKRFYHVDVVYKTGGVNRRQPRYDESVEWSRAWSTTQTEMVAEVTLHETASLLPAWPGAGPEPTLAFAGTGRAIQNQAGDPFDPPITRMRKISTLSLGIIVDELSDISAAFTSVKAIKSLEGKINSDAVTIADYAAGKYEVMIDTISIDGVREANTDRLRVGFNLIFDSWLHVPVVLNAGYNQITAAGDYVACVAGGKPVSTPARLNIDGSQMSATDDSVFIAFGVHNVAAFAGIFPTDM